MESEILGLGIRNAAQGIRNPTNDWIPESKSTVKDCNPLPGMRTPTRGIHN